MTSLNLADPRVIVPIIVGVLLLIGIIIGLIICFKSCKGKIQVARLAQQSHIAN